MIKPILTFKSLLVFNLLLILNLSCTETEIISEGETENLMEVEEDPYSERYGEKIVGQPFEINFQLNEVANEAPTLQVNVDIIDGSFILSHYAGDEFSGRFLISLDDNEYVSLEPSPTESPAPQEEIYFWAENEKVKKHKGKILCAQKLAFKSEGDFEIEGAVTFTVEPSCGFYKTIFTISRKSNVMEVKKIETVLNPES